MAPSVEQVKKGTLLAYNQKKAYFSFLDKKYDEFYCVNTEKHQNVWISSRYSRVIINIDNFIIYTEDNSIIIKYKTRINKIPFRASVPGYTFMQFGSIYILDCLQVVYIIDRNNNILTNFQDYGVNEISLSKKYCYLSLQEYYGYDSLIILSETGNVIFTSPTRNIGGWVGSNSLKFTIEVGSEAPNHPTITNRNEIYTEDIIWEEGNLTHLSNYQIDYVIE